MKRSIMEKVDKRSHIKIAIFAWIIEILASLSGFAVAYTQYDRGGFLGFIKSGTVVFVIIALLELTKIPLLDTIYKARSFFWRCLFLFLFLFSVFLTFETFNVALQMNYAKILQVKNYEDENGKKYSLSGAYMELAKINNTSKTIDDLDDSAKEEIKNLNSQIKTLESQRDTEIKGLENQKGNQNQQNNEEYEKLFTTLQDQNNLLDEKKKGDITSLENRKRQLKIDRQDKSDRIDKKYKNLIENEDNKIIEAQKEVDYVQQKLEDNGLTGPVLFGLKSEKRKQLEQEKADKESALQRIKASVRSEKEKLSNEKIKEQKNIFSKIDSDIELLDKQINSFEQKNPEYLKLKGERDTTQQRLEKLSKPDTKVQSLDRKIQQRREYYNKKIDILNKEVSKLIEKSLNEKNKKIETSREVIHLKNIIANIGEGIMIYNMALNIKPYYDKLFEDEHIKENPLATSYIDRKYLDLIAMFWFSSVSFFAAVLGSSIYLAYLVRRYPPNHWFRPLAFLNNTIVKPITYIGIFIASVFGINRNIQDVPPPTLRSYIRKRIRRILALKYRKAKTPKIVEKIKIQYVEKEVPKIVEKVKIEHVEKEVSKVIEKKVPVEVVKKEYIHVPLYTNDISKLSMYTANASQKIKESLKNNEKKHIDKIQESTKKESTKDG